MIGTLTSYPSIKNEITFTVTINAATPSCSTTATMSTLSVTSDCYLTYLSTSNTCTMTPIISTTNPTGCPINYDLKNSGGGILPSEITNFASGTYPTF